MTFFASSLRSVLTIIKGVLVTLVLLITLMLTLTATESGSRWLLRNALSLQQQLNIAGIEGTLLGRLSLRQLNYLDSQGFKVSVDKIDLQWHSLELLTGSLHIEALHLNGIALEGQPESEETTDDKNSLPNIPLIVLLDELTIENVTWKKDENETRLDKLALTATLQDNTLNVSSLALNLPEIHLEGHGSVQIQNDWPLTVTLDWSYAQAQSVLRGHTQLDGSQQRYHFDNVVTGLIESEQQGFITLAGTIPEFNFRGSWNHLQWPLSGSPQAKSERGTFQLQGTTQHYQISLNANIAALDRPVFPIAFAGSGNLDGITIEHLLLQPSASRLELNGQLNWQPVLDFDLALGAEKLNPSDFGTDVPGQLNIKLHSQGHIDAEQYDIGLQIEQLDGKLFDQTIQGEGQLKLADRQLQIDHFKLSAGDNHVLASGDINEQQADLDLQINARDLRTAWPTLAGKLKGRTSIKGLLQQARIKTTLMGSQLRFTEHRISSLSLALDYAHGSQQQSKLDLTAQSLKLAGNVIDHLTVKAGGNPSQHDFLLRLQAPLLNLDLGGEGRWNANKWQGRMTKLLIDHPQLKQWRIASPSQLNIETSGEKSYRLDLSDSCLLQDNAKLCLTAHGSPAGQLDGGLRLSNWPLSATEAWLPQEVTLEGRLSAQGQFLMTDKDINANLLINLPSSLVRYKDEDNLAYEQTLTDSTLFLHYAQDKLKGDLQLGLGQGDTIQANVLAGAEKADGSRPLSGSVKAKIANMRLIDSLLPEISNLQGHLSADLKLDGDVEQPHIIGGAQWRDARFTIPRLGTQFDKILVKLDSDPNNTERLLLNLSAQSGQGNLSGHGHLDLLTRHKFPLQLTLTGKQFQIVRLPEAEAAISPEIRINKYDDLTRIEGQINIDNAQVELNTLPETAIAPSEDEVIISTEQTKKKTIDPTRLNAKVAIDFGKNSRFEGFGLKTRLGGKLEYLISPERQRMQGRAEMRKASYRAYGQDLTIRKGEFLFNGPADNPWLNIEAIRKAVSDDVTAVLNVTGPLKSPETKVYTEPSLPESEALSYLVTGKSTKWLGKGDSTAVANAAFNYGAGQLSWLSDRLGIDEFEFEQGDKIQDSAVRLGQYLNPDLYVGVTMGLFSNKYAANLKYRLSEHFNISTQAGESQRIDLKYQFETD